MTWPWFEVGTAGRGDSLAGGITAVSAVVVPQGCCGVDATSLVGDGERDLNKPELVAAGWRTADLLEESSLTDGLRSTLLLLAGSQSLVLSRFNGEDGDDDVVVVVAVDSNDERIFDIEAVWLDVVGLLDTSDRGSSTDSEWKRERAFLTTDGLPSTGLADVNLLFFNKESGDESSSLRLGDETDRSLGRSG